MTMGPYGVYWDRTQTWWGMAGAYHTYLARCQDLLRQGLPVADILYLVPEGAPQVFRPPSSATEGDLPDRRGYSFDGCAPNALQIMSVCRPSPCSCPAPRARRGISAPSPRDIPRISRLLC